ncbi:hypothetical protein HUG15_09300 [Salicibibacter cibarius]|uniref:Uncharacterized protein n=1 Tax=Salicibibacter cibarius TaxID=2743000 RepID=A0A7T6Z2P3_9BACI|nr:hypothetical protein [Salicibibacter cibarius]QQK75742.1 hypothetical protein HUG15_09300 [Salicibibacter cibarius]
MEYKAQLTMKEVKSMSWISDAYLVILFGLAPIVASIVLGTYWLKNERFPWEK